MHLLMRDLLKSYNSLNDSIKKTLTLIENKWIRVLQDNNITYLKAYTYEHGSDPHTLEMDFHLQTQEELTHEERIIIEREASCKLTNQDKKVSMLNYHINGKTETYFYTFTPLKITPSPVENSWLKD